jgi:hypothetical protein
VPPIREGAGALDAAPGIVTLTVRQVMVVATTGITATLHRSPRNRSKSGGSATEVRIVLLKRSRLS